MCVAQIEFNRECGEDNVCEPELRVDWLNVSGVVVGSQSARAQVIAHLQVHNYGDTAYSVTLNVSFPRPTLHFAVAAPEHAVCQDVSLYDMTTMHGRMARGWWSFSLRPDPLPD